MQKKISENVNLPSLPGKEEIPGSIPAEWKCNSPPIKPHSLFFIPTSMASNICPPMSLNRATFYPSFANMLLNIEYLPTTISSTMLLFSATFHPSFALFCSHHIEYLPIISSSMLLFLATFHPNFALFTDHDLLFNIALLPLYPISFAAAACIVCHATCKSRGLSTNFSSPSFGRSLSNHFNKGSDHPYHELYKELLYDDVPLLEIKPTFSICIHPRS